MSGKEVKLSTDWKIWEERKYKRMYFMYIQPIFMVGGSWPNTELILNLGNDP